MTASAGQVAPAPSRQPARGDHRCHAAALLSLLLVMMGYIAVTVTEQPWQVAFPLLLAPAVAGRLVLPMTLVAAVLRWLWLRLAPERRASSSAATAVASLLAMALYAPDWLPALT